jgi:hypothetical protein
MQDNALEFKDQKDNLIYEKEQQEKICFNRNISRLRENNE